MLQTSGRWIATAAVVMVVAACSGSDSAADSAAAPDSLPASTVYSVVVTEPTEALTKPGDVVITEIHYHPADEAEAEFVEVANVIGRPVDLDGWCIAGFDHCFPAGTTLSDGEVTVVDGTVAGGRLGNGGERLELVDESGAVVDAVGYDDRLAWPALADGEGWSLQRLNASESGELPGNWIAAEPTPGVAGDVDRTTLPTWTAFEHTVSPVVDDVIVVKATVDGARTVRLEYTVGFGEILVVDTELDSEGSLRVEIPGQESGQLVRFRLVAATEDGTEGTWPRQGDGAEWTGTVVASNGESDLPRLQWFMPPDVYATAAADLTLTGDDGYPAVVALDGIAYSNSKVRVKGGSSRGWPKPKFKFVLPAGHELDLPGHIDEPVDEFAIHAAWNDKTFAREYLSAQAFQEAGQRTSDVFPVRIDLNREFFGLYLYVEQPDGSWRDRHEFNNDLVYDVGAAGPGFFSPDELELPTEEFRKRYAPETPIPDDDLELRRLIAELEARAGDDQRDWLFANVDVPQVLNFLAVSSIIQHQDFWSKNIRVMLDEHGRWSVTPHDLELTYGRRWYDEPCQSQCDVVDVSGSFDKSGNPLWGPFSTDPVLAPMLARRIETLIDVVLEPASVRADIDAYAELIDEEAARDRKRWGTFGEQLSMNEALDLMYEAFVMPQHERLTGPDAPGGLAVLPPQPGEIDLIIESAAGDDELPAHIRLSHDASTTIDVSGASLGGCDLEIPMGTVIPPGGEAVLVTDNANSTRDLFEGAFVAGFFDDDTAPQTCTTTLLTP